MDWLPGATRKPMHEDGFAWQANCPTKIVWHTTEGFGLPSYPSQYEPHFTVVPAAGKGVAVYQHIALTKAAYALKHTGSAPTNGAHAIQIELAGTCDPHGPKGAYYWPEADDTVLRALWLQVGKPLADAFHVPLAAPTFRPYPASAGANGVRFTDSQWLAWSGHCGHQHIPGNDHGDPGAFPWDRLVQIANGDDDMPLTDDDAAKVAKAVFNLNVGADGVNWGIALQRLYNRPPTTAQDIAAAIVAQFKTLPAGTATVDDATIAKVAQATATELATRLVR
jgi:hypothetical protein